MKPSRIAFALPLIYLLAACSSTTVTLVPSTMPTNTPAPIVSPLPSVSATPVSLPVATATDPASVFMAYYGALIANNLDAAMALVADGPTLCYKDPCLTTKDQIRAYWQRENFDSGWFPYVSILRVDGNTVSYAWTAVQHGRADSWGTGKVVVEAGKIKSDR